jgi:hypothetical protein
VIVGATMREDVGRDAVPLAPPPRIFSEQDERAVERDPAHDLAVHVLAGWCAGFPDALVRLAPTLSDMVGERSQCRSPFRIAASAQRLVQQRPVEDFAMHVYLALVEGVITDAHRPAPGVAVQVIERALRQIGFAVDAVHDLQLRRRGCADPRQVTAEAPRFTAITGDRQRVEHESRVAQPAIPVVPVAAPADLLGQRCGGCRDQRPRRGVDQQLDGEQAALDRCGIGAAVAAVGDPFAPERRRRRPLSFDRRKRLMHFRMPRGQDEDKSLSGHQRDACLRDTVAQREVGDIVQQHRPAIGGDDALSKMQPRRLATERHGRPICDPHVERPAHRLDNAHEPLRRDEVDVIVRAAAAAATDRHEIGDDEIAAGRGIHRS